MIIFYKKRQILQFYLNNSLCFQSPESFRSWRQPWSLASQRKGLNLKNILLFSNLSENDLELKNLHLIIIFLKVFFCVNSHNSISRKSL